METVLTDPTTTITLTAFSTGVTALAKKLGVQGDWLILVCIASGALYTVLLNFQPELLSSLFGIIVSTAAAGNVALVKDLAQTLSGTSRA